MSDFSLEVIDVICEQINAFHDGGEAYGVIRLCGR